MRALFLEFPDEAPAWEVDRPVHVRAGRAGRAGHALGARERDVYLPAGASWLDAWTGEPVGARRLGDAPTRRSSAFRSTSARAALEHLRRTAMPSGERSRARVKRGRSGSPAGPGSPSPAVGVAQAALAGWLFLTPAIAYLLFAFAIPIVYNVMFSFEQTSPATIASLNAPLAGLSNYTSSSTTRRAAKAIVHTFGFTVGSLAGQFLIGFALALLFSTAVPGADARALARDRPLAAAPDRDRSHLPVHVPAGRRGRQPGAHGHRSHPPPGRLAGRSESALSGRS